jgi:hypothetical protein
VRGIAYTASAGAAADPANARFPLAAADQLTGPVWVSPLIPDPLFSSTPAPAGSAVAIDLQLDAAAAAGEIYSAASAAACCVGRAAGAV